MHARSTWSRGRARLAAATTATALSLGAALIGASPAMAATTPTLTGPASVTGWTWATMTGTARAGATVTLWEAAYVFKDDMGPATSYFPQDIVQTTADTAGHFTLRRRLDSGFRFQAEADGLKSAPLDVGIVPIPYVSLSTSGSTVTMNVQSEPGQEGLPVHVQRLNSGVWTNLLTGATAAEGLYTAQLTGQSGSQSYRALAGPDASNRVLVGASATLTVTVGGTTPPVVTNPTTPTTPTTPVPVKPKAGDIRFSLIYYDPAGTDTTAKLNQEYFRLTNFSTRTFNMKGFTVKDRKGNTYRFLVNYNLAPKKSLYVRTGKGRDASPAYYYRYWQRTGYVWDNTGDSAYLRTAAGALIDSCSYGKGNVRTYC